MSRRLDAVLGVLALTVAAPAGAQEWRAAAQYGRVSYDGLPTVTPSTSALVLGLNRTDVSDWLGVSAAIPLANDPFWGVAAGSKRFEAGVRFGPLLDLSGHAFLQRDISQPSTSTSPVPLEPPPPTTPPRSGQGAGTELAAGLFAVLGPVRLQTRAGAAAQASELAGVAQQRFLPLADARLSFPKLPLSVSAEARGWSAPEGKYAYAALTAQVVGGPLVVWGSAGRWLEGGIQRTPWSGGARVAIGDRLALEVSARGNTFDPLYRSETGTSIVIGTSVRLGDSARRIPAGAPIPAAYDDGVALLRIRAADVAGAPAIAGDFTDWKPQPMQRDRDRWTFTAHLAPGVYHYAFVNADGKWFVPESVPGRQSDGMGGEVAVLVVSQ